MVKWLKEHKEMLNSLLNVLFIASLVLIVILFIVVGVTK